MNTIMIDSYILVKPSTKMYDCIKQLDLKPDMPERLKSLISNKTTKVSNQQTINDFFTTSKDYSFISSVDHKLKSEESFTDFSNREIDTFSTKDSNDYLQLEDLLWLNNELETLRQNGKDFYLHELLQGSVIYVPENEKIERNPVLEKRCELLKTQQENRRYKSMTKNVDTVRIREPEDTIAYQMKQLNKQLIAVFQFIVTVLTGFAFGFIGIELMVGKLDFGFKLLLGIMCALIIALAELYFLAKQLAQE